MNWIGVLIGVVLIFQLWKIIYVMSDTRQTLSDIRQTLYYSTLEGFPGSGDSIWTHIVTLSGLVGGIRGEMRDDSEFPSQTIPEILVRIENLLKQRS